LRSQKEEDMTYYKLRLLQVSAATLLLGASLATAQTAANPKTATPVSASANDLTWLDEYAKGGDIKWDKRFIGLIQTSLNQRQNFWYEKGKLVSTLELVQVFLGISGDFTSEKGVYSIEGCVPHACPARGLLWIDTTAKPKPTVVFVAMQDVYGSENAQNVVHLMIYSSSKLDWQKLPPAFVKSLHQWWMKNDNTNGEYLPVLATLIGPNGIAQDIDPNILHLKVTYATR